MLQRLSGLERTEIEHIDAALPYLSYSEGQLNINGAPAVDLWDGQHPLIIFFPDRAVDNYRTLKKAFSRHFSTEVYYALKACYFPSIVHALRRAGAGIEVMGDFEWKLAARFGFPPHRIVANGTARATNYRDELVSSQAAIIGVDGREELECILEASSRIGIKPKISIRVNPLDGDNFFHSGSKLGLPFEESYSLLETALTSQNIEVVGLHAHQLRHCIDTSQYNSLARRISELAIDASTSSRKISFLNLGGGLESRFVMERSGVTCADLALAAKDGLAGIQWDYRLVLEPGRYITADAAIALTGILGTKRSIATNWLVTEIGTNILPSFRDRAYYPLPIEIDDDLAWCAYSVTDAIAIPSTLCANARLPKSVETSSILLLNCGAYTTCYSESWGCELPDISVSLESGLRRVFGRSDRERILASLYGEFNGQEID